MFASEGLTQRIRTAEPTIWCGETPDLILAVSAVAAVFWLDESCTAGFGVNRSRIDNLGRDGVTGLELGELEQGESVCDEEDGKDGGIDMNDEGLIEACDIVDCAGAAKHTR